MKKTELNEPARSCCRNWPAIALVFALALGALLWATTQRRKDILETAASFPECSTFVDLVDKAGMTTVLAQDGPFTVSIPTNEAFAKIPQERLTKISG
ncbi:MAG: fasciclin domain-containing protein, partial [Thermoguttaceae bacterium]|nr:fasciclin domain-containing protein [Thermoguttaceae bacterium]